MQAIDEGAFVGHLINQAKVGTEYQAVRCKP
jgi:hypothetical protein